VRSVAVVGNSTRTVERIFTYFRRVCTNLQVIEHNGVLVTDSRDIAEMIEKRHDHLLRDIKGYIEVIEKTTVPKIGVSDFFLDSSYQDSTGRTLPCYLITKKGCDMVANKMTGEKGILFTATYVTRFEEMEKSLVKFNVPQSYAEALRAYADEVDRREKLETENKSMLPKAEFFDQVASSKDAIDLGSAAKVLNMGIGRNKLFETLRSKQILMQNNQPYQKFIDAGYFRIIEQKYVTGSETRINIKTLVYQRGLAYIRKLVKEA